MTRVSSAPEKRPFVQIMDEFATIQALQAGKSIARFGDGEFQLIFHTPLSYVWNTLRGRRPQVFGNGGILLSRRLLQVLQSDDDNLLVGIPNVFFENSEKIWKSAYFYENMNKIASILSSNKTYYSAFFCRFNKFDPNKDTQQQRLKKIWHGRNVGLVNFNEKMAADSLFSNAGSVKFIHCKQRNSWGGGFYYRKLLKRCLQSECDLFLVSAGPVAKLLALDLVRQGKQCIDIGQLVTLKNRQEGSMTSEYY